MSVSTVHYDGVVFVTHFTNDKCTEYMCVLSICSLMVLCAVSSNNSHQMAYCVSSCINYIDITECTATADVFCGFFTDIFLYTYFNL